MLSSTPMPGERLMLAACNALVSAPVKSRSIPMTSPVDFISGPMYQSTPTSLDIEKTGALMPTSFWRGQRPPLYPMSLPAQPPSMTRVARLAAGTPVTLEMNGMVRLPRGFTSSTYTVLSFGFIGMN